MTELDRRYAVRRLLKAAEIVRSGLRKRDKCVTPVTDVEEELWE
jgi:transcription termination factor Rho